MPIQPATLEVFSSFLARMEQVIASRVGAGRTLEEAWSDDERWRRELRLNLRMAADVEELLERIRANLAGARSAREVHEAFDRMRGRLAALATS